MTSSYTTPSFDTPLGAKPVSLVKKTDRQPGRNTGGSRLTNVYLQDSSKQVTVLKFLQYLTVLCLLLLAALLANFSSTNYRVFGTSREGALTALPPLDQELMDNVLSLWVADSMIRITTIGFHDYTLRLNEIRGLFTDRGWESFSRFLRASYEGRPSLRSALETGRLIMWGEPASPPQVLQRSLVSGVMTYRVKMEMTVKSAWFNPPPKLPLAVELTIERVRPDINPAGIAIAQWRVVG